MTIILQRWCLLLLLSFAGMALTHPAIAKGGHGGRGHGSGDGKSAGKTGGKTAASKDAPGKGIKTAPHTPAESGGATSKGDTNPPPSEAPLGKDANKFPDKAPGTNDAGVKPKIPQVSHNPPVAAPANTITRNAIGMPVTIHGPASNSKLGAGERAHAQRTRQCRRWSWRQARRVSTPASGACRHCRSPGFWKDRRRQSDSSGPGVGSPWRSGQTQRRHQRLDHAAQTLIFGPDFRLSRYQFFGKSRAQRAYLLTLIAVWNYTNCMTTGRD